MFDTWFTPVARQQLLERTFLREAIHFPEIGSTNDEAIRLVSGEPFATPYLLLADRQTAGRGRGANTWWAERGALTFTLVLDPFEQGLRAEDWPQVSLAVALAVSAVCQQQTQGSRAQGSPAQSDPAAFQVKWPNDVYWSGRKISGVLVEIPSARPPRLVVGVGVNVNNSFRAAPEELRHKAVALADVTGRHEPLAEVLEGFLLQLQANLDLLGNEPGGIARLFRERCLLSGRIITLDVSGQRVTGRCRGIDDRGALVLDTAEGEETFFAGVVAEF